VVGDDNDVIDEELEVLRDDLAEILASRVGIGFLGGCEKGRKDVVDAQSSSVDRAGCGRWNNELHANAIAHSEQ
jgi:hypothetical protein